MPSSTSSQLGTVFAGVFSSDAAACLFSSCLRLCSLRWFRIHAICRVKSSNKRLARSRWGSNTHKDSGEKPETIPKRLSAAFWLDNLLLIGGLGWRWLVTSNSKLRRRMAAALAIPIARVDSVWLLPPPDRE